MRTKLPTDKQIIAAGQVKSVDSSSRRAVFIFSDGDNDRHGESLNPMGWQVDNYMNNPVVLFGHKYSELPIGKTIRIWVENGKQLLGEIEFATHEFAEKVWQLVVDETLNAGSVGFIPLKYDDTGAYTYAEQELLEYSIVPVPANPRALSKKSLELLKDLGVDTEDPESTPNTSTDEKKDEKSDPSASDQEVKEVITMSKEDLQAMIDATVKQFIKISQESESAAHDSSESKTKEALIVIRELLKSSDKKTEEALKKLKEISQL